MCATSKAQHMWTLENAANGTTISKMRRTVVMSATWEESSCQAHLSTGPNTDNSSISMAFAAYNKENGKWIPKSIKIKRGKKLQKLRVCN